MVKEENDNKNLKDFKNKNNFCNIIFKMLCIVISVVLIGLFIGALTHTAFFWRSTMSDPRENMYYENDNIIFNILNVTVLIFGISLIKFIFSKINNKILISCSIIIILFLGYNWINFVKAPVVADQEIVLDAAYKFSKNDFKNINVHYFYMHPLQYGCVLGLELIIRLFKINSYINIQIINLIVLALSVLVLYLITNKLYEDKNVSKIISILISVMFVIPLFSIVVYGNIFGMFFSLLSIYFLLKYFDGYKVRYIVLMSLANMLAIIWKSNYEIVMIALLIALTFDLFKNFRVKTIVCIITVLSLFAISHPLVYRIIEQRTGTKVNEGVPMISYIAMAMQEPDGRPSGWYHGMINVESIYIQAENDEEKAKEKSIELIKDRIEVFKNDFSIFKWFYKDKISSTWLEPAFQTLWWAQPGGAYHGQNNEYKNYVDNNDKLLEFMYGKTNKLVVQILDTVQITVYFTSLVSIISSIKSNKYNNKNSALIITFLGGFLFHILWETKSIYVIPFYIMLLPSAADGIETINVMVKDIFIKLKESIKNRVKKEVK